MPFIMNAERQLPPARQKKVEDLLAGLMALQPELGLLGNQLVFLLLAAGIEPTHSADRALISGVLSNSPH